jgi:copper chaperone CopZ
MDAKKVSILSAIAASSCCVPPLILLGLTLLGIGTAGVAGLSSTLGAIKWYILPLAVAGVGVSYWLYFREKKACAGSACKVANEWFTKTMLTISTVVVVGFLGWSVYPYILGATPVPSGGGSSSAHFAVYQVDGMTCGGCEIAVDEAIKATCLVDSVKSSFMESKAYIWFEGESDLVSITKAIASVGYEAKLDTLMRGTK